MSESEFELEFSTCRLDLLKYNYFHIGWLILIDWLGLIAFLILAFFSAFHPAPSVRETLGIILFWATILLAFGLSQPMILFLQIYILKSPQVMSQLEPRKYIFTAETILIDSGTRVATIQWNRIIRIRRVLGLILLYTSPKLAYLIPERIFADKESLQSFLRFLFEKIKKPPAERGG